MEEPEIDLTTIDKPFGTLPEETKMALFRAWLNGEQIQTYTKMWYSITNPGWHVESYYRVKHTPALIPDSVDWSQIHPDFKYIARDSDGRVYVYRTKPVLGQVQIVFMAVSGWWRLDELLSSYKQGTVVWQDSLVERPTNNQ